MLSESLGYCTILKTGILRAVPISHFLYNQKSRPCGHLYKIGNSRVCKIVKHCTATLHVPTQREYIPSHRVPHFQLPRKGRAGIIYLKVKLREGRVWYPDPLSAIE